MLLFGEARLSGARTCSRGLLTVQVWGLESGALGGVGLRRSSVKGTEMGDTENCMDVSCTNFSVKIRKFTQRVSRRIPPSSIFFTCHDGENASATASIAFGHSRQSSTKTELA